MPLPVPDKALSSNKSLGNVCQTAIVQSVRAMQRTASQFIFIVNVYLTFRHRASSMKDRRFATLQRTLFIYLINKYISLSEICLTVHH